MDSYKKKYLKYKKKYFDLKNQHAGSSFSFNLNLSEWTQIENSGQHNCGIFLSDIYPNYIVKCGSSNNEIVNEINKQIKLFPNIINSTIINNENYITMEKLDGDITSIFFDMFPKIVLNKMINERKINEEQKQNIFILFKYKIQSTTNITYIDIDKIMLECLLDNNFYNQYINYLKLNNYIKYENNTFTINGKTFTYQIDYDNYEEFEKKYNYIKKKLQTIITINNITIELYDEFINRVLELLYEHHTMIFNEMIKKSLLLTSIGYYYSDNKFDNYGYILSNTQINDLDVPIFMDKYFYVYFLDWDSGLIKLNTTSDYNSIYTHIIDHVQSKSKYFSVNGQNKLSIINTDIISFGTYGNNDIGDYNIDDIHNLLNININTFNILKKSYDTTLYEN